MQELTRAEEEVMQIIWKFEKAFVKEVRNEFPDPKPAYNTVSTIVRILEKKAFLDYTAYGKSHQYFPIISKEEYTDFISEKLMKNYFDGSFKKMLSFFANHKEMNVKELDDILKLLKKKS